MKKCIGILLILGILFACVMPAAAEPIPYPTKPDPSFKPTELIPGDVDLDGNINAADAFYVLKRPVIKKAPHRGTPAFYKFEAGNVDGDNLFTANDALWILKKAVGKVDSFPVKTVVLPPEAKDWIWGDPPAGVRPAYDDPVQYWRPGHDPWTETAY